MAALQHLIHGFPPSRLCHGNVHATSRQRPSSAQGLRAFGTLRERAAHSGLPGKQLDATTSRVGAGGGDAPPRRGPALPARRRPPLAGGCELLLVKPSPGIYRSLERNEVAFGEGGREGGLNSHRGQCTAAAAPSFSHPGRPAREEAAAAAGASREGGGARAEARRTGRSARPGPRIPTLAHQLLRLSPPRLESGSRRGSVKLAGASSGAQPALF